MELTGRAEDLVFQWREARAAISRARATEKRTERELLDLLGDAEVGTVNGHPVVCVETVSRPGIDLARLREEHPELWEQYPADRQRSRLKFPARHRGVPC
jgi:hypothetical protein